MRFLVRGARVAAVILAMTVCLFVVGRPSVGEDAARPVKMTRWANDAPTQGDPFYTMAYPRPGLCRADGIVLNGLWEFATSDAKEDKPPGTYPGKILVPFSAGSPLSRVARPMSVETLWYRRTVIVPQTWDLPRRRAVIHFNSIDGDAVLFVNGKQAAASRDGGSFDADITSSLQTGAGAAQEIVVSVTGHGIGPFDGIWQTVWIEPLAVEHIEKMEIVPDLEGGVVVTARCTGDPATQHVEFVATDAGMEVARAGGKPGEQIMLPIAAPKSWSPAHPFLYDLRVVLSRDKQKLDEATSYFGVRKIAVGKDEKDVPRILLNGKFVFQAGVLDAGRWPDGGATAPSETALRKDIEAVKQLGFNMVRKTGKIEPDFWYYRCDRLGVLVWQDVPNSADAEKVDDAARERELRRLIEERGQHPSIVAWVVGGNGAANVNATRDAKILKAIDRGRLIIAAGVPIGGDPIGDVQDMAAQFPIGPGGARDNRPAIIGDFDSLSANSTGKNAAASGKGDRTPEKQGLTARYIAVWEQIDAWKNNRAVSAAVYRELTDVAGRDDGLMSADRAVFKIDLESLLATAGRVPLTPQVKLVLKTARADAGEWTYTDKPADGWNGLDCDVSKWTKGFGPLGTPPQAGETRESMARSPWTSEDIFVRREFTLGVEKMSNPSLLINQTGDLEVFINGRLLLHESAADAMPEYVELLLDQSTKETLRPGRNVIAVHCRQSKDAPRHFLDFGLMDILPQRDCRLPAKLAHWPILDTFFRDTSICLASDGNYYLTGTTGNWGKEGIRLYKSADLEHWDDLGFVWTPEKNATWQMKGRKRESFCLWAPEIHYLKGTFWIPYCTSYAEAPGIQTGTGLLKSVSGKAEGPYEDISPGGPLTDGLDASLFQDDDGAVYFLHGGSSIARMKDDMSGLAEKSHDIRTDGPGVGYEGIFMFKHDGKYYWSATANGLPDRDYDCFVAFSDKIEGPYHDRQLAVSHGGHNMFFKDKRGKWWSSIFGGDVNAPFIHRPGIIPIEFAPDGTIHPVVDGTR